MGDNLNTQDIESSRYSSEEVVRLLQIEVGEVLAFAAAMARRTGLGLSEMSALEHLQHAHGGLTPTELGKRLSLSSGAITALVDRLERTGHVERRPNPADRRSSVVLPVPEGLEEAGRHLRPVAAELLEKSAELTDEERAAVGRYLEVVTEVFRRHARG
jgi:DNA-binding MarR family transcriptional regulator